MSFTLTDRESDYNKWKVADLRKELRSRGLNVEGKKNELVERLQLAVGDSGLLDDTVNDQDEILDEDVLTDDDAFEDSVLTKPDTPEKNSGKEQLEIGIKRKSTDTNESIPSKQSKKIVLNRNVSAIDVGKTEGKENQGKVNFEASGVKANVVKVGVLSPQERLERRAAKFGVPMSSEAKKEARAARFGLPSAGSKVGGLVNTNIDLLKKRAERFGTTLPGSILEKAEIEEKRKKREERFGKIEKAPLTSTTVKGKLSLQKSGIDEKKRLRAERFKLKQP